MNAPELPERYEPGPLVGRGAMGTVWRARDRVLDVAVAIKVPHAGYAQSSRGRTFFEREVRAAAAVVHPHLVPLHDWGRLPDGTPFLAMAWADGGSLENPPATWPDLRDRIAEVLAALAALHARGLVHRDLKPANVLLHQGRAWVVDLGLAAATDDLGRGPARVEGTPRYMAPEQREGRVREIGPATDLFAVGAMIDELTRHLLVPEDLDGFLAAMLHPDPLGRYDLAADARRALRDLGEPAVTRPDGPLLAPLVASSARSRPRSTIDDAATYVLDEEAVGAVTTATPPWHRPAPPSWPSSPPPEPRDPTLLRASLPLFALREPPLIGRDGLRERLWAAAGAALRTGKPRVVVLCGEPGAGKTRLTESVARALEEGGHAEVLRVRHAASAGADDGFEGAARRLVRAWDQPRPEVEGRIGRWLARDHGPDGEALAASLCAWAGLRRPEEPAPDPRLGTKLVLDHLRARSWRGCAALLADDAHHEPGTFELLNALLVRAALGEGFPLLALVSCDPQRLDEAGRRALDRLVAAGAERIDVPPLDRAATRELVEVLLPVSANVGEWLAHRCEGNPRLARHILQHWADRGVLTQASERVFTAAPGVSLDDALPPDAASAYLARLDGADADETSRALVALAAAGEALPHAVFSALAGGFGPALLASGLVRRDQGWCRWEHGVVVAALRARLDAHPERSAILEAAADAWQRFGALSGRPAHAEVGLLRLAAGRPAEALGPLLTACHEAVEQNRMEEHDRCAEAALAAAEVAGSALDRARARHHAATARNRRGHVQQCVALALAARDGFLEAGAWAEAADAIVVLRGAYDVLGERESSSACVDAVRALAEAHPDPSLDAARLRGEARSLLNNGRYTDAEALLERLAEVEHARGSAHDEIRALHDLARARARQDHLPEAREVALRALALAKRLGALVHQGPALHMLGQIAMYAAEHDEAERQLQAALELAVVSRDELRLQVIVGDLAHVAHMRGDLARARAGYDANLAYSTALGLRHWELVDRIHLAVVTLAAGDATAALAHGDRLEALAAEIGEQRASAWPTVIRLAVAVLRDDRAHVAALLDAWAPTGAVDQSMCRVLERGALAASERGWTEEARTLARIASEAWLANGRPDGAERLAALTN